MKRRLAWFLVVSLAFWALGIGLAYVLLDDVAVTYSAVAGGICLVPSLATLTWATWGLAQSPEQQLTAALGGTGVRMALVLGVGLLLTNTSHYFAQRQQAFWFWILAYYLFDLGLEMTLLVAGRSVAEKQN